MSNKINSLLISAILFLNWPASATQYQAAADAYLKGDYVTAYRQLLPLAESGNADAQLLIGDMYRWGEGVAASFTTAAIWYRKSAEQGNLSAQETLGKYYFRSGSRKRAFHWLQKAAKQNSPEAKYLLAYYFVKGIVVKRNVRTARHLLYSTAVSGNARAQTVFGFIATQSPNATDEDQRQGITWLEKAAQKEFVKAQLQLGLLHLRGKGVEKDAEIAAQWFLKAAKQGDILAQYELGKLYETGTGVAQSDTQAYFWYRLAERKKFKPAAEARKRIFPRIDKHELHDTRQRADAVKLKKPRFSIEPGLLDVIIWR